MQWTTSLQRGVLAALLDGSFGCTPDTIHAEWFTKGLYDSRPAIAAWVLAYRDSYGEWPKRHLLQDLPDELKLVGEERKDMVTEVRSILFTSQAERKWAAENARKGMRRHALLQAADLLDTMALAEEDPDFAAAQTALHQAAQAGEAVSQPFDYGQNVLTRHRPLHEQAGCLVVPTGFATLDRALRGGLHSGQLGLVMAPTNQGKSQWCVALGAAALQAGIPVLHVSLEMSAREIACRYDRCLTDMTELQIEAHPSVFTAKMQKAAPNPELLKILPVPRQTLTLAALRDKVKGDLDSRGPHLLLIDYISIMKPLGKTQKFEDIAGLHEGVSSLVMEEQIPCWSPFQSNREAESSLELNGGTVRLHHAAGSYDAHQHGDVTVTLTPHREEKRRSSGTRLQASIEKSREGGKGSWQCSFDWEKSRIWENKT